MGKRFGGAILGTGTTLDLSSISLDPSDVVRCRVTATDSSNAEGTGSTSYRFKIETQSSIRSFLRILRKRPRHWSALVWLQNPTVKGFRLRICGKIPQQIRFGYELSPFWTLHLRVFPMESNVPFPHPIIGATATSSATVSIQNSEPFITGVQITPENPVNSDTMLCSVTAEDPDQETLSETFTWYNDSTSTMLVQAVLSYWIQVWLFPVMRFAVGGSLRCSRWRDSLANIVTVISTLLITQGATISPIRMCRFKMFCPVPDLRLIMTVAFLR